MNGWKHIVKKKSNSYGAQLRNRGNPKSHIKHPFEFVHPHSTLQNSAETVGKRKSRSKASSSLLPATQCGRRGKCLPTKSRKQGAQRMTSVSCRPVRITYVFPLLPCHVRIFFCPVAGRRQGDRVLSVQRRYHGIRPEITCHMYQRLDNNKSAWTKLRRRADRNDISPPLTQPFSEAATSPCRIGSAHTPSSVLWRGT